MTACQPIAALNIISGRVQPGRRLFVALAGLAMAAGTVVLFEPAPYDFAFVVLLAAGVLLNRLSFTLLHRVPILLLAGYFVVNVFSTLNAQDLPVAIKYNAVTIYLILSWLFFTGFAGQYGRPGVNALLRGFTYSGWAAAALSSLAFFHLIPYSDLFLKSQRAQGLFKDPNVYGPYLVAVAIFGVAALQRHRLSSLHFVFGLAASLITGIGIFLSFSRGAWINCAVSLVYMLGLQLLYGLLTRRVPAGLLYSLVALGLLAGAGGLAGSLLPRSTTQLLAVRLGNQGLQNYDRDRFDTQRRALATVREQPMGIGPGQSEVIFDYSTHSMYVRILTETGAFGFITFYAFMALSFLRTTRKALTLRDDAARGIFAALSACLLGTFINGLVIDANHWRHLWFLLGLAWWVPGTASELAESGGED